MRVAQKRVRKLESDAHFCARLRGWFTGVVELTGGKGAETAETRCRCRGHEHCVYVMTWQV